MVSVTSVPDDGFKVPDEPTGRERYGDWVLVWSGWQHKATSRGYQVGYSAWWMAVKEGYSKVVAAMANGPLVEVEDGGEIPEAEGLSVMMVGNSRIAERAHAYKAEAKARLLDALDARAERQDVA